MKLREKLEYEMILDATETVLDISDLIGPIIMNKSKNS
jgi:hypothetical protein